MKQIVVRLALLALLIRPALAGNSDRQPDDFAAGTFASTVVASEPGSNGSLSPNLMLGLFVGSVLLSLTLHLALRHHRRRVRQLERVRRKEHLMTPAERDFLAVLEPLVRPVCRISIRVRLADLFEIRPERGRQSAFYRISNKHIDFLLTAHDTNRILCGILLDDRSRRRPGSIGSDAFVDRLFASQQIPLVHVPGARCQDSEDLRDILAVVLGKVHAG